VILRKTGIAAAVLMASAVGAFAATVNTTSNVVFIVDESGSMAGEQAFLTNTVGLLDSALFAAGVIDRSYGVVGFGSGIGGSFGADNLGRAVGGTSLADAATTATNLGNLLLSGGFEDGYSAIDYALNNLSFTAGAAVNFILVTDEDRDNGNVSLTSSSILSDLSSANILLNAVVNASFQDGIGASALGIDSSGDAYLADGVGNFTTSSGGVTTGGIGTTEADYVDVAIATGGAAWNLNFIDGGGTNLDSFTQSFIDIKVQEITSQPPTDGPSVVPLPAAGWMLIAGLGGMAAVGRRRKKASA